MIQQMKGVARFLFLVTLLSFLMIISKGLDTITTTQFLTDKETIVSSEGTFELGFFSFDNSKKWFLGIWYKKVSVQTVVWSANRDTPINDKSGAVLKINEQGILSLLDNITSTPIWSSANFSSKSAEINPVARLLESGNLVVKSKYDSDDDPQNYLWQSFDHPTNTLLPDMKLGVNFITGVNCFLSNGIYTYGLDTNGFPQIFLKKDSVAQFRSGPWNGLRSSGVKRMLLDNASTFESVFNKEEAYRSFKLLNRSIYSRITLNQSGIIKQYTWDYHKQIWDFRHTQPEDCDFYGLCHGYGICNMSNSPVCGCLDKFVPRYDKQWDRPDHWFNGCIRRTPLDCKSGDIFVKYSKIKLPDTRNSWYSYRMNLEECKNACLKNCTCMAYANIDIRGNGSGCLCWSEDLMDMRVFDESGPDGQDIYVRMASSELDFRESEVQKNNKKETKPRRIRFILPAVVVLVGLSLSFMLYLRNKKKKAKNIQKRQKEKTKELELPSIRLATIAEATNNFTVNNMLGEGGFGHVYKGILEDGQEIAVKRLSQYSAQGLDEFMNEVICITKLQHRNLVRLLGCCIQGQEKMLIYEYMPNNSLDFFLFDQTRSKLLEWPKRFDIISGTARGLLYLHQDSRLRIIHRDLKPANILLDIDMNPKISDFGMARSFCGNETAANTKRVVGTYGYMSPEYAADGMFSVKSDVFSFGVVVLEIVSGKRNRGFSHADHQHSLLGHAWLLFKEGRSTEMVDANLRNSCNLPELLRSIHVGLLCVQQHPEDRPSMSIVVHMLDGDGALPQPKEPGFFTKRNQSFKAYHSSPVSANGMSITQLEAR